MSIYYQDDLVTLGADLSDRGVRTGPLYWGQFQQTSNISHIQDYRDWFNKAERALADGKPEGQWMAPVRAVIDFEPLSAARAPQSWLVASMPIGSEMSQAWGTPGFSMVTLDDPRLRRDTPTDTLENLNVDAILPQLDAVKTLFRQAWNDPKFKGQPELKWQRTDIVGQVVSAAPGRPVPELLPSGAWLLPAAVAAGASPDLSCYASGGHDEIDRSGGGRRSPQVRETVTAERDLGGDRSAATRC